MPGRRVEEICREHRQDQDEIRTAKQAKAEVERPVRRRAMGAIGHFVAPQSKPLASKRRRDSADWIACTRRRLKLGNAVCLPIAIGCVGEAQAMPVTVVHSSSFGCSSTLLR